VVTAIGLLDISLGNHNEQPPHGPGEDELDAEAPPELEEIGGPSPHGRGLEGDHVTSNGSDTGEENFIVPLFNGELADENGNEQVDNGDKNVPAPEDGDGNP